MLNHRQHRGVVLCEREWPQERHLESHTPALFSDTLRVGRQYGAIDHSGFRGDPRGILEERSPGERTNVLVGNSLGPAARGNESQHSAHEMV